MRYFFHIAYSGTNYRGWQTQKKVTTIQEIIEGSLGELLKKRVHCCGCGRTDAGVHASQYFFHIDYHNDLPDNFVFILNKMLPKDIVVYDIIPVQGTPHAQFSATERSYTYYLHTEKNPFISDASSLYALSNLNTQDMITASDLLVKYSDYQNFCKTPDRHDSTICHVKSTELVYNQEQTQMIFRITADRFLKNMIRIIVGRLLDIGEGRLSIQQFENYLRLKESPRFFKLAYPQGLYLSKIEYPFLNIEPRNDIMFND